MHNLEDPVLSLEQLLDLGHLLDDIPHYHLGTKHLVYQDSDVEIAQKALGRIVQSRLLLALTFTLPFDEAPIFALTFTLPFDEAPLLLLVHHHLVYEGHNALSNNEDVPLFGVVFRDGDA
jgi:hypothetical protein